MGLANIIKVITNSNTDIQSMSTGILICIRIVFVSNRNLRLKRFYFRSIPGGSEILVFVFFFFFCYTSAIIIYAHLKWVLVHNYKIVWVHITPSLHTCVLHGYLSQVMLRVIARLICRGDCLDALTQSNLQSINGRKDGKTHREKEK